MENKGWLFFCFFGGGDCVNQDLKSIPQWGHSGGKGNIVVYVFNKNCIALQAKVEIKFEEKRQIGKTQICSSPIRHFKLSAIISTLLSNPLFTSKSSVVGSKLIWNWVEKLKFFVHLLLILTVWVSSVGLKADIWQLYSWKLDYCQLSIITYHIYHWGG